MEINSKEEIVENRRGRLRFEKQVAWKQCPQRRKASFPSRKSSRQIGQSTCFSSTSAKEGGEEDPARDREHA